MFNDFTLFFLDGTSEGKEENLETAWKGKQVDPEIVHKRLLHTSPSPCFLRSPPDT